MEERGNELLKSHMDESSPGVHMGKGRVGERGGADLSSRRFSSVRIVSASLRRSLAAACRLPSSWLTTAASCGWAKGGWSCGGGGVGMRMGMADDDPCPGHLICPACHASAEGYPLSYCAVGWQSHRRTVWTAFAGRGRSEAQGENAEGGRERLKSRKEPQRGCFRTVRHRVTRVRYRLK